MKKIIIITLLLIISCKDTVQKKVNINSTALESDAKKNFSEAQEANKWLEESIVRYFKTDLSNQDKIMKEMTTKDYYEFKTDATNVDLDTDNSLNLKEFQQKWGEKYDTGFAGINTGFLISGQDWINIEVRKSEVLTSLNNVYIFDVILADDGYKAQYHRKIKVLQENNRFLVDGIIELE